MVFFFGILWRFETNLNSINPGWQSLRVHGYFLGGFKRGILVPGSGFQRAIYTSSTHWNGPHLVLKIIKLQELYHLESRRRDSHVLVYHGPLLNHILGVITLFNGSKQKFAQIHLMRWQKTLWTTMGNMFIYFSISTVFFWGRSEPSTVPAKSAPIKWKAWKAVRWSISRKAMRSQWHLGRNNRKLAKTTW